MISSRSPLRRACGITPSRAASWARSAQFSFGRCVCCRCRTASWWRRIRISTIFHASSRRDSRSHVVTRAMRRKTNRRHMTGDHHGRTAGRATLLVTATDGKSRHAQHQIKFMIRDPGPDYTAAFDAVLTDAGIRTVLCSVRRSRHAQGQDNLLPRCAATPSTSPPGSPVTAVARSSSTCRTRGNAAEKDQRQETRARTPLPPP